MPSLSFMPLTPVSHHSHCPPCYRCCCLWVQADAEESAGLCAASAARGGAQRWLRGGAAAAGGGAVWAADGQGVSCLVHHAVMAGHQSATSSQHAWCLATCACLQARLPACHTVHRDEHPHFFPPLQVRKTKPELKSCPECGARVGLSAESVRVHLKLKHADWDGCQVDNVVMSPNGSNTSLSPRFPSDVHQPCSEAELSLH